MRSGWLLQAFWLLHALYWRGQGVEGRLVNITVDDTNPDPLTGLTFTYSPASGWNSGNGCNGCTAHPDPALAYDSTWHDATYADPPTVPQEAEVQTASFEFTGSAIFVFGILSHSQTSPRSTADILFFIDGQLSGTFVYVPPDPPSNTYTYDVLLFADDSLELQPHTLTIQNGIAGGEVSLILLDYVIYARDDGTPTTNSAIGAPEPTTSTSLGNTVVPASVSQDTITFSGASSSQGTAPLVSSPLGTTPPISSPPVSSPSPVSATSVSSSSLSSGTSSSVLISPIATPITSTSPARSGVAGVAILLACIMPLTLAFISDGFA